MTYTSALSNDVKVSVKTEYVEREGSTTPLDFYLFFYSVSILNNNPFSIKLLSRKWYIADGITNYVVEGEGVIGQQPELLAGSSHHYTSGCRLNAHYGKMHGIYIFERVGTGERFEVDIPHFTLIAPWNLN